MKANEFVKKFGLDEATAFLSLDSDVEIVYTASFFDDLKRLVESHELIKKDFESVEMAEYEYMISASYNEPYWVRVKQAIADVESCTEVGKRLEVNQ